MKCPYCGHLDHRVLESRTARNETAIRRRRECLNCERRFTTFEQAEAIPVFVIKRDGSREEFRSDKCVQSMRIACFKRDVGIEHLLSAARRIEAEVQEEFVGEVPSSEIGDRVLRELFLLDTVAYVRFASVYKQFETISDFEGIIAGVRDGQDQTDAAPELPKI